MVEAGSKDARLSAFGHLCKAVSTKATSSDFHLTALSGLEVEGRKIAKEKPELGRDQENCSSPTEKLELNCRMLEMIKICL